MVDRALGVHALLAAGKAPREVERRLGKSKGYVSVLGYLGAALAGLEPEDLARLRAPALTPRVVWPLVTRARTDERAALTEALGAATTDAAREDARRRARDRATVALRSALRAHAQAAAAGLTAPPKARGGRRPRAAVAPFGALTRDLAWDPAAWAADPVAYARAHLAALAAAHDAVVHQAAVAVRRAVAEHVLGAQVAAGDEASLRRLGAGRWRALADGARAARTPADAQALALLAGAARPLRGAPVRGAGRAPASDDAPTWADVDADLDE